MNHREPLPAPGGVGRALQYTVLLLLSVLGATRAGSEVHFALESLTPSPLSYLAVVGALPLRFQEALPPPDLAAGHPTELSLRSAVLPDHRDSASAKAVTVTASDSAPPTPSIATFRPRPNPATSLTAQPPVAPPPPPSILSDEMRPNTRPEDFLPYFQLPGASLPIGEVAAGAPAPGKLPASTANYTQK